MDKGQRVEIGYVHRLTTRDLVPSDADTYHMMKEAERQSERQLIRDVLQKTRGLGHWSGKVGGNE